jgi:SulP family sulfate permease
VSTALPTGPVRRWARSVRPHGDDLKHDVVAAVPDAIGAVPDGMACAVLVGVNPVYGLYASFAGRIGGGLSASTRLMVITTTSAAALAAGSALSGVTGPDRAKALFLLTLLAGGFMLVAGLFRLGRYVRFVSHSVMIGFLTGVAVNIVLGQLGSLTGASAEGSFALARAVDVVTHPGRVDLASLLVGLGALAIMVALAHTRLASLSAVIALVVPTAVMMAAGLDSVARVDDVGTIPGGFPRPALPDLSQLSFSLVVGALAVAAIVLVQGAGVAESAPNADGASANIDQDFVAQGVGNLASGFFKGQPVGGSVGSTALNRTAGARSRWASILSGVWVLAILVVFAGVVGNVALPTLAAVLIYAAVRALRWANIVTIWRTGLTSQVAMTATFVATLFLPITAAVGVGVALSLMMQLNREALDLRIVQLVRLPDGRFEEHPAPPHPLSHGVTLLDVYGSLYYAGARTLQVRLPDPTGARSPAVVLRLRGRTALGATFIVVVKQYAERVAAVGGRLFLSGVDPDLYAQLLRTGAISSEARGSIFESTVVVGESSSVAYAAAEAWLAGSAPRPSDPPDEVRG